MNKYKLIVEEHSRKSITQRDITNQISDPKKVKALYNGSLLDDVVKRVNSQSSPVIQVDKKSGRYIKEWMSESVAARELDIYPSAINRCVNHLPSNHSAGGYGWISLTEYKTLNPKYESVT